MMDWLGFSLPTLQPIKPHIVPEVLNQEATNEDNHSGRTYISAGYGVQKPVQPSHYHYYQHPNHIPHVHNYTHNHTIFFEDGSNHTYWHDHHHPPGHHHHGAAPHHGVGGQGQLGSALSGWYQMNMGLIGIGALAVVAIIGSRNFFSNYVTQKYGGQDYDYGYDIYNTGGYGGGGGGYGSSGGGYGGGGGGYGGYNKRKWEEDWYDYWYKNNPKEYLEEEHDYNAYDRYEGYKRNSRFKRDLNDTEIQERNRTRGNHVWDTGGANRLVNGTNVTKRMKVKTAMEMTRIEKAAVHCGFRLICELSQGRKRLLTDDEWEVLRLSLDADPRYKIYLPAPATSPQHHTTFLDSSIASEIGAGGGGCQRLFGNCRLTRRELLKARKDFRKKLVYYFKNRQ